MAEMSIDEAMSDAEHLRSRLVAEGRLVRDLHDCCVGSKAAFQKLLLDRNAIPDEMLQQIIARLAEATESTGYKT